MKFRAIIKQGRGVSITHQEIEDDGANNLATLIHHYGEPTNYRIKPNNHHSAEFTTPDGTMYVAWREASPITLSSQTLDALKGY